MVTCPTRCSATLWYLVRGKKNSTEDKDEEDPYQCCISISSRRDIRVCGAEQERRREEARSQDHQHRNGFDHRNDEAQGEAETPQGQIKDRCGFNLEQRRNDEAKGQEQEYVVSISTTLSFERVGPGAGAGPLCFFDALLLRMPNFSTLVRL
jgi:hypothetical protein